MFICTECNEKFKIKPEYCSCGNDEFRYVSDGSEKSVSSKSEINEVLETPRILRVLPIGIFSLCLVLSVFVWFINPEPKISELSSSEPEVVNNIPDIDSIWVDSVKKEKDVPAKKEINSVKKEQALTPVKPVVKSTQKPKTNNKTTRSNKNEVSKNTKPKSSQVQSSPKIETKPVVLPQSIVDTVKPSEQQVIKEEEKQNDKVVENIVETPQVKDPPIQERQKMSESEFLNYKGAIRSALLAKLNVVAIKGSGDCAIEFSLDDAGKLINRNFIYKSSNKSINDEVYNMLMRLPYYKQPPMHYNGEKIKLKFMFNNGYYEITFI